MTLTSLQKGKGQDSAYLEVNYHIYQRSYQCQASCAKRRWRGKVRGKFVVAKDELTARPGATAFPDQLLAEYTQEKAAGTLEVIKGDS